MVLVHIAAVAYYLVRRKKNLIKPMLDGDKAMTTPVPPSRDDAHHARWLRRCSPFVRWQ